MSKPIVSQENEQQGSLARKTSHLEALHRVGVALAGSFDIESILHQIADATTELLGDVPVDVFYSGSRAINSKPKWVPPSPTEGALSAETRLGLEKAISTIAPNGGSEPACDGFRLETWLHRMVGGAGRRVIPISRNSELVGIIVLKAQLTREDMELLSILSLQAATALHNIHLNQQRIHAERLSAFGQMIGSLVHDFRSPLTAVRGYCGMLAQTDLRTKERENFARLAIEELDRLNRMIDELLELTRGRRAHLDLRRIDAATYLTELMPAIRAQFDDSAVGIDVQLDYSGPLRVDPHRMKRAVLNVASNASQAMNGAGSFSIRSERRGDHAVLEFQDTGCGIPEELRHRIFEPFFSHGKPQGIGLGMSITRRIVEEHGGEVELVSEVGRGTRVRFVLPLSSRDADRDRPASGD